MRTYIKIETSINASTQTWRLRVPPQDPHKTRRLRVPPQGPTQEAEASATGPTQNIEAEGPATGPTQNMEAKGSATGAHKLEHVSVYVEECGTACYCLSESVIRCTTGCRLRSQ